MKFLDTYAIIEIQKGNPAFRKLAEEDGVTSKLNLAEVYYILLTTHSKHLAETAADAFSERLVDLSVQTIKAAMLLRKEHNEKNRQKLSYADAIGYTYALENNLIFVTGDDAFKGLKGVEFLK